MSTGINIKDLLSPGMRKVLAKVRDARPILAAAGAAIVGQATRAFRDPSLRPAEWPELASSTLARKGGKGNTLIDTGALVKSIIAGDPTPSSIEIGTDRPYAPYHQSGTKRMPARPFMPWTDDGRLTPAAERAVREAIEARLRSL